MRKCIRCNRSVIIAKLCRRCEFEFRQKVKQLREDFSKQFTKSDRLDRFARLNPKSLKLLRTVAKDLGVKLHGDKGE